MRQRSLPAATCRQQNDAAPSPAGQFGRRKMDDNVEHVPAGGIPDDAEARPSSRVLSGRLMAGLPVPSFIAKAIMPPRTEGAQDLPQPHRQNPPAHCTASSPAWANDEST